MHAPNSSPDDDSWPTPRCSDIILLEVLAKLMRLRVCVQLTLNLVGR